MSFSLVPVPRWRVVSLAGVLLLAGCGGGDKPAGPAAAPAAAGPTAESVVVKKAELPGELGRCPYSGSMSTYLQRLGEIDAEAQKAAAARWAEYEGAGATDGYVSVHTGLPVACNVLVSGGAAGHGHAHFRRSVTSIVIQFPDAATAEAAYNKDIFKQSQVQGRPGAEVGAANGLGPTSVVWSNESTWTEETPGPKTYQAVWQNGPFYMSVKTENITRAEGHAAAVAQHGRAGATS